MAETADTTTPGAPGPGRGPASADAPCAAPSDVPGAAPSDVPGAAPGGAAGDEARVGPVVSARSARRRAAMIEAAMDVFTRHGFAAASLDMVIERSGGSRRTLYEQFGNKEGLFLATVDALLGRIVEGLEAGLRLGSDNPEEDLARAGTGWLRALLSEDAVAVCRLVMAEIARFPSLGQRFYDTGPSRSYGAIAAYLRQQTEAGRLAIADPDAAACQFVEMLKGDLHLRALLCGQTSPPEAAIDAHVRSAVRLFLKGAAP
ncbi:MAG: TetR/AcrR family transcriptional regulator [Pseudomonadota bacterium]